jgi:hypothetical protein
MVDDKGAESDATAAEQRENDTVVLTDVKMDWSGIMKVGMKVSQLAVDSEYFEALEWVVLMELSLVGW